MKKFYCLMILVFVILIFTSCNKKNRFEIDTKKEKWLTELDNFRISNWEDIINESILNQYCPVKF